MLENRIDLARRVDRAEINFCAVAADRGARGSCETLERAGGLAVFGHLGSPLNKVLGLGLGLPVTDEDLDAIEAFYHQRGSPVAIELCPLAGNELAGRLCARQYVLEGFEDQLGRRLTSADHRPTSHAEVFDPTQHIDPAIVVRQTEDDECWLRTVAEGFAAAESGSFDAADDDVVHRTSEVMKAFLHPSIQRYLAFIYNEPAGAGATYVHDGVLGIFGTATRPRFRRRGVQSALTRHCLRAAHGAADLAIATTEPGSTSERTFQRLGFQVLYTRAVFVKRE